MSPSEINSASMLRKGTVLRGIYRIDSYLSSGGFGNTYVATNIEFDEQVAIKEFFMKGVTQRDENQTTVSVSNSENKDSFLEQREKFKKEARRIRQLKNEHIVTVHDLFDENGTSYYVMDYVDGENLAERLKRTGRAMTESEVRLILPQILEALKAVHEAGIWHLDLKPANIMLGKGGLVKLIDFGASKQLNSQKGGATTGTAITYTNGYAPREQMEQNYDKFGPWTDIYALGATFYTLFTNKRPPLPSDIDEDISEDKHVALPLPNTISVQMKNLVLLMMKTNRRARLQAVSDVVNELSTSYSEPSTPSSTTEEFYENEETFVNVADHKSKKGVRDDIKDSETIIKQDEAYNLFILGERYYNGKDGVEKDYVKAKDYFFKSANLGFSKAEQKLGDCYYYGRGVFKDFTKAVELYTLAASQNEPYAEYCLGICYYNGQGVPKDFSKAANFFKNAANKGFVNAQSVLGLCFYYGHGVSQDYSLAIEYWKKGADKEDADSLFYLGRSYYEGNGITKDQTKGKELLMKASKLGQTEAEEYLKKLEEKPRPKKSKMRSLGTFLLGIIGLGLGKAFFNVMKNKDAIISKVVVESTKKSNIVKSLKYKTSLGDCSYTGPVNENNIPDGIGEATFEHGYYKGPFKAGIMEGKDCFFQYTTDGGTFEGEFRNNSFYQGKYTLKNDGSYFVGTFKNGQPSVGTWYNKNGIKIEDVK